MVSLLISFIVICIRVCLLGGSATPFALFPSCPSLIQTTNSVVLLVYKRTFQPRSLHSSPFLLDFYNPLHSLPISKSLIQTMLFSQIICSAAVVGSAVAALNERFVDDGFNALTKRQQFIPTTQTAAGDTCADAFGAGYLTCTSGSREPCASAR
jgi:hypothetical protein